MLIQYFINRYVFSSIKETDWLINKGLCVFLFDVFKHLLLRKTNVPKTCRNETIGLLSKLQNILPREPLLTIYKSFVRPHLDYDDVIYDQHCNNSFHQKLESIQYNAALAITGAIRGSSREKLYQ